MSFYRKEMKKILAIISLVALLPLTVQAQKPRVSTAEQWDVSVRTYDKDSKDPGPGYEFIVRVKGKPFTARGRGFSYPLDMLEQFGNVWLVDADFDGHTDVLICLGTEPAANGVNKRYDAWLYNPDDGKFYCPDTFCEIPNPSVDKENTRIVGYITDSDGRTKICSEYYWQRDGNIQRVGETWKEK